MKILASGDHHFHKHSRFAECIAVHKWLVELAHYERVDAFLSAGDIYEAESTPVEREAVKDWLLAMAEEAEVLIARGNHDRHKDLAILASLRSRNRIVVEEGAGVHFVGGVRGAAVAAMAWPEQAALLAALGDKATADMATRDALQAVLRGLGRELDAYSGSPKILLGHFMVDGSITSVGQPLLGMPINVSLSDLALARANLGIMSHIHKAQCFDVLGAPHVYTGSPFRTDFGQLEKKTVVLAEFDGPRLVSLQEIETPATKMVHLTGEWRPNEAAIRIHEELDISNSEVRVIYDVDAHEQRAARLDEERLEIALRERGAASVKIQPQARADKRARIPEIATARTIAQKLPLHWQSIGFEPGDRREPLLEKAAELEIEVGGVGSANGRLSPRLEWCRFHNFGPFEDFTLDLRPYADKPVIALDAPNGSGKTTCVETAFFGANYLSMPTQGTLVSRARAKDAFVERSDGQGYVIRHNIDGVNRKHLSSTVTGPDGQPCFKGTGARAFGAWASEKLVTWELLGASAFTAQGSRGFLGLQSADRISVILQATGVERIEKMATAAGKRSTKLLGDIDALAVRIVDAQENAPGLDVAEREVAFAREAVAFAEARQKTLRRAVAEAEQAAARRAEIEREATAARETCKRIEREHAEALRRLHELGQRYAAADPQAALEASERAESTLRAAREALVVAEAASREADAARAAAEMANERRSKLEGDIAVARASFSDLAARVENGKLFLSEAESIRAAVVRVGKLQAELAGLDSVVVTERANARAAEQAIEQAGERMVGIERRIERARETLAGREEVAAAQIILPNLEQADADARAELERASAELDALRELRVAGAEERIGALRGALVEIRDYLSPTNFDHDSSSIEPVEVAACRALEADDSAVRLAAELPEKLKAAITEKGGANARAAAAAAELAKARTVAARADAMLAAEQDLETAERELIDLRTERAARERELVALRETLRVAEASAASTRKALESASFLASKAENLAKAESVAELRAEQLASARAALDALLAELRTLPPAVELPPPGSGSARERVAVDDADLALRTAVVAHAAAEATRRELMPQVSTVRADVERLTAELAAAPKIPELPAAVDVDGARAAAEADEQAGRGLAAELARAEQRLDQAKATAARVADLETQRLALAQDQSDWNRLALDLGRDGIQSSEVDSAGPELTELINDLLHKTHGPRFTVTIETKRAKADGKGDVDECRVNVIDTVDGTEKEGREHSGGETSILGDAVSLGLLILGCRRAGFERPTIVRDESANYLDEENRRHYVPMLRRAAEAIGAQNILIINHDPEVRGMADAVIQIPARQSVRPRIGEAA